MTTKIVVIENDGKGINGNNVFLEVDGRMAEGQLNMTIDAPINSTTTATIVFNVTEIEYRKK